ncbi:bis(5'-nucleosyl)-tetraphosphatase (symmetrical) [Herbaspirillum sp. Sphag1AN]|uniref:symmetrical bis(5'-nucleosyl)-tetraphosphatase n=1 Tax=unclassified Herbaspirillum TaxID=2624150 RepID=UPI001614C051|nr:MULTISPECIES: symmetrical bis(5'-nucleosyl)-tetraphosphatase [unclassified Herbaspirillum]MBB3213020.1 bis(5'-nucleosyl)-tetraphosphatase (symmetrical) [Herbaspirillum sp. Sphag1AN]MBB3246217.1 bis(5'-nucleosyl)-tetraphosphatase (symmetrical) [Herbaspirillum sp. Sphag64]
MPTYAIGDLQGCGQQLQNLLSLINQTEPNAQLLFVGDLVNRGPQSLETLRQLRALGDRAKAVLGNHDLHLLAVSQGIRKQHRTDTLDDILHAPDREELLDWVRHRPLALLEHGHLLFHAGILPEWTAEQTMALAHEVETVLRGPDWVEFLRHMYGNEPAHWRDDLQGHDRLRCIVNTLTRLRFCTPDGGIDFTIKEGLEAAPPGYVPWFDMPERKTTDVTCVFGHWASLGLTLRPNLIGLDTGCVWGGKLTAVRLEDRELLQVSCPQAQQIE